MHCASRVERGGKAWPKRLVGGGGGRGDEEEGGPGARMLPLRLTMDGRLCLTAPHQERLLATLAMPFYDRNAGAGEARRFQWREAQEARGAEEIPHDARLLPCELITSLLKTSLTKSMGFFLRKLSRSL